MHTLDALGLGEAAVRAGDDVFAPDQGREPDDSLGHEVRMFNDGCVVSDDAGDEDLARGKLV
jgi:hypothetical protein